MNPKDPAPLHRWLLLLIPRVAPVVLAILGWYFWRWPGLIIGFVAGCVAWFVLWIVAFVLISSARLRRLKAEMSALSTEELQKIATDPSRREMGFAIAELERRGIKRVRPSLESLFELLTSPQPNKRALGFSQLAAIYPSTWAKICKDGDSSTDPPEVWRERIAALDKAT